LIELQHQNTQKKNSSQNVTKLLHIQLQKRHQTAAQTAAPTTKNQHQIAQNTAPKTSPNCTKTAPN